MSLRHAPCDGLPSPNAGDFRVESLLLVYLTDLEEWQKEKLLEHLQPPVRDFQIQTWYPSVGVLECLAWQGRYIDSKANLYGIARVAYRKGYSHFIVADELTKRQLQGGGIPLRGEDARISVVMIAVRQGEHDNPFRIIAKRSAMESQENKALLDTVKTFDISQDFDDPENGDGVSRIYSDLGFELHDPDCPVFTPNTKTLFGHEDFWNAIGKVFSQNIHLPKEIVLDITSRIMKDTGKTIELPPGLDFKDDAPNINIILGFTTTQEKREDLLSVLQNAVHCEFEKQQEARKGIKEPNTTESSGDDNSARSTDSNLSKYVEPRVHLIPWEQWQARSPSRRVILDLSLAVTAYMGKKKSTRLAYSILPRQAPNTNMASAEFISISDAKMGTGARLTTLSEMVRDRGAQPKESDLAKWYEDRKLELLPLSRMNSGYDEPFYPVSHPWEAIGRMNSIPLFFLTNKLSDDQIRAIYQEIQTLNDIDDEDWGNKVICAVPWKEDEPDAEDGTPADMWRLSQDFHGDDTYVHPLVFVDLQSGEDLKVIMTDMEYVGEPNPDDEEARELLKDVEEPEYRGLVYGRLPGRDAHITWANLNIANMGFDEFFHDENAMNHYLRPDWPCHHRIDEYNEWIYDDNA